jgi:hypothetical protein
MTPTARTLDYLRKSGFCAEPVERWIPEANVRRDLFHCIDIIACTLDEPILAVQCTSLSNVSSRVAKAKTCPELAVWLKSGHGRFWVRGWANFAGKWTPKIVELAWPNMAPDVLSRPPRRSRDRHRQADMFQETSL